MKSKGQHREAMFDLYAVTLNFEGKLVGSVPMDPALTRRWLEQRAPENPKPGPTLDDLAEEVISTLPEIESEAESLPTLNPEQEVATGFQRHPESGNLVVRSGTIKAHLKDCARQIQAAGLIGKSKGSKSFRTAVANYVNVIPYWVEILKDGKPIKSPDGWHEQPVHVMTSRGPRNALKMSEYVLGGALRFGLVVLKNPEVGEDELSKLFVYGGVHGYGGERSLGEGRYVHELEYVGDSPEVPRSLDVLHAAV